MPSTASSTHHPIAINAHASPVLRVEVAPAPGHPDPIGDSLKRDAAALGISLSAAHAIHVYLIEPAPGSPISAAQLDLIRSKLLADPVTETSRLNAAATSPGTHTVEVHPLPGVMDPVAQSVQQAIAELLGLATPPQVSTGWRYDLTPAHAHTPGMSESCGGASESRGFSKDTALSLAARLLANPVIQKIHATPFHPSAFPHSAPHAGGMGSVKIIGLTEAELTKLSREAHLFLSLDEMLAVQEHYTTLGRDPREIELETLAQTWSEHCVHKTLKSKVRYRAADSTADPINWSNRPGIDIQPDGTIVIDNLLNRTVAAATHTLIADGLDWTLSVFSDNSGVIAFDDAHAVCIKVETHNHPSAIEPYGGAATGIGGCIRDVIGTGLGARPIANTDVFCVANPATFEPQVGSGKSEGGTSSSSASPHLPPPTSHLPLPEGCLPPRRILTQVVAGVRDYGNRMGIPTVSGAVYFDDRYVGNPLVFAGCIGVMPRNRVHGQVKAGDLIVALGGRTGRDGIHGATFSSAELEHTATDEFSHAVQIGNAITEKQTLDAIIRARDDFDAPLYHGLTDCGAGGFSSAVGEMGKNTGAIVHLEKAPLKYAGLSATEIWISEAQERMVLAVPQDNLARLQAICDEEHVELAVLGTFTPAPGSTDKNPDLALMFHGQEVGRLNMHFLHEGIPTPRRDATWSRNVGCGMADVGCKESSGNATPTSDIRYRPSDIAPATPSLAQQLTTLLSHPNIASKHWIIRQYDHEVRGQTALKPLVGPLGRGPGDASIVCPVEGSTQGLAISCGLQTGLAGGTAPQSRDFGDPYLMTLAAIDECVRNLVCVGADPSRIAILDNFCWPSCSKPNNLGSLVRAAIGCYDGALAYRTPFVSGKDSLNNQFTTKDGRTIEIPPTLLITGMGIVPDVRRACSMDAKKPGNIIIQVGRAQPALGGSHYQQLFLRHTPGMSESSSESRGFSTHAHDSLDLTIPTTDLTLGPATARAVASLIEGGLIASAHDVSDGGLLTAIAEMLIAGSSHSSPIGAAISFPSNRTPTTADLFGESPSRYVLEVSPDNLPRVLSTLRAADIPAESVATLNTSNTLTAPDLTIPVEDLAAAWLGTLDW